MRSTETGGIWLNKNTWCPHDPIAMPSSPSDAWNVVLISRSIEEKTMHDTDDQLCAMRCDMLRLIRHIYSQQQRWCTEDGGTGAAHRFTSKIKRQHVGARGAKVCRLSREVEEEEEEKVSPHQMWNGNLFIQLRSCTNQPKLSPIWLSPYCWTAPMEFLKRFYSIGEIFSFRCGNNNHFFLCCCFKSKFFVKNSLAADGSGHLQTTNASTSTIRNISLVFIDFY